jgi:hypothetical protein
MSAIHLSMAPGIAFSFGYLYITFPAIPTEVMTRETRAALLEGS